MKTREHSDLYLTYDSYKNVLHATRSSNGTDGFLRYLHDEDRKSTRLNSSH